MLNYAQLGGAYKYGSPDKYGKHANASEILADINGAVPQYIAESDETGNYFGGLFGYAILYARSVNSRDVDKYVRAYNGIQIQSYR